MYLPRMRLRSFIVAAVLFVCAAPAQAQFFRNNAFSFDLGWQGMGSTFDSIAGDPLWNINDQLTIGAGYTGAAGYQLWYDLHTSLGMSTVRITDLDIEPIVTLNIWTGIRYNFLEEGLRPFVSIAGQFLQVVTASKNIPLNALFGNTPVWVGARLGGGSSTSSSRINPSFLTRNWQPISEPTPLLRRGLHRWYCLRHW